MRAGYCQLHELGHAFAFSRKPDLQGRKEFLDAFNSDQMVIKIGDKLLKWTANEIAAKSFAEIIRCNCGMSKHDGAVEAYPRCYSLIKGKVSALGVPVY